VYEFKSFFEENTWTSRAVADADCTCIYRPETTYLARINACPLKYKNILLQPVIM
jgi:hypothetical protein